MLNGYLSAPRRRGTHLPQLAIVLLLSLWSITPMAAQASLPTDELLQTNIAGSFDGTRYDLLDDDARHNPASASFSVSLWFKPDDLVSTQMLLQKGNTGSSIRGWSIFIESGRLIIRVNASNDSTQRASTSVALGTTGQWQHVVGVVNRSTNRVVGYLNGSNAGFSPGTGGPTSDLDRRVPVDHHHYAAGGGRHLRAERRLQGQPPGSAAVCAGALRRRGRGAGAWPRRPRARCSARPRPDCASCACSPTASAAMPATASRR